MKYLLIAVITGTLGFLVGELRGEQSLAEQIAAHQDVCSDNASPGYASYPVTHWGELRGCLRVPESSPPWAMARSHFVKVEK